MDTQGGVLLVQRGLGVEWVVMEEQWEAIVQEGAGVCLGEWWEVRPEGTWRPCEPGQAPQLPV